MSIIDNLLSRVGYIKADKLPRVASSIAGGAAYSIPDASEADAQISLYSKLTWISNAIDFTANAAAVLDFNVSKIQGEDSTDIPNHPFELLLRRPNEFQSRFEFLRDYFSWRKLTGNVYVHLNRPSRTAPPTELWIIPSNLIRPVTDENKYLRGYLFTGGRQTITLETWEVMHDKSFNPITPFVGMSALQSLAVVAAGDYAQQAYSTKLFDKDNAKIPGALAFSDMVNDADWNRMQAEAKTKWGGIKQSGPMWLRGVGSGVSWLQMALSQKDMDFIAQRQLTEYEVYSKLGRGMKSLLSDTATEANALAGKAIFSEYELWPMLCQASEKITSDILPSYGGDLVGAFDDPRKSDRLLDLQEQDKYSQTHTVNEVRAEYYGDDPIEGGDVPISQWVGVKAETEPESDQPEADDDSMEAIQDLGGNTESTNADAEAELKAWERFAVKRLGKGGRPFAPRVVDVFTAARINAGLKAATTPDAVRRVFAEIIGGDVDAKPDTTERDSMAAMLTEIRAAAKMLSESTPPQDNIHRAPTSAAG